MIAVHLEIHATSYDEWRRTFDLNQPIREQFGVKHVTLLRPVDRDDDTTVFVIAEVDSVEQAEALLAALREKVFSRAAFTAPPKATVTEVETITQA